MELSLTLCLPRDAASVPLSRRVASELLKSIGFLADDVADVELALTEACSNVLRHTREGEEYEVRLRVDQSVVTIEVEDKGPGIPAALLSQVDPGHIDDDAETGRGLMLIRALVDDLRFEPAAGSGSVVRMTRTMRTEPDSPSAAMLLGGAR